MNTKQLTGIRKTLFLKIAQYPNISKTKLCAYSRLRGGEMIRIGHHLVGLESEGFIQIVSRGKTGQFTYKITLGKGGKMLEYLQQR